MGRERQGQGRLSGLHKHTQDTFQPHPIPNIWDEEGRSEADSRHAAQGRREAEREAKGERNRAPGRDSVQRRARGRSLSPGRRLRANEGRRLQGAR